MLLLIKNKNNSHPLRLKDELKLPTGIRADRLDTDLYMGSGPKSCLLEFEMVYASTQYDESCVKSPVCSGFLLPHAKEAQFTSRRKLVFRTNE